MSVVQSITTSLEGKIMGVEKLHLLIGLLVAFLLYLAMNRKEKFESTQENTVVDDAMDLAQKTAKKAADTFGITLPF